MLKIKNEVDLKELEKFGFEKGIVNTYKKVIENKNGTFIIEVQTQGFLMIIYEQKDERCFSDNTFNIDIIYDLIQAGLVEKVKKDIEILEEKLNGLEENGVILLNLEDGEILKKLLTRYKQLEEENKELKEKWDRDCYKIHEMVREENRIKTDYIPKSKVKEKIEEYEKKIDIAQGEELLIFESKVDVLQELLREE